MAGLDRNGKANRTNSTCILHRARRHATNRPQCCGRNAQCSVLHIHRMREELVAMRRGGTQRTQRSSTTTTTSRSNVFVTTEKFRSVMHLPGVSLLKKNNHDNDDIDNVLLIISLLVVLRVVDMLASGTTVSYHQEEQFSKFGPFLETALG
mmetsp:Transcript_17707/g.49028  ORF Transcript_17707/g.49028 Transcript_17707/m.49028 type:complete len:151 (+) Transcript_17707:1320-1772(+)